MNNGNQRKRPPPASQRSSSEVKHQATAPAPPPTAAVLEDDFVDEDVFLDETLISGEEDEESLILRDIEEREALASRLSKWARPPLSRAYLSESQSISKYAMLSFLLFR